MDKGMSLELQQLFECDAPKIVSFFIKNDQKSIQYFDSYEDMRQELLMKVWLMMPKYDASRSAFTTFVGMICKTVIRQKIRKSQAKKRDGVLISMEEEISEGIKIGSMLTDDFNMEDKTIESSLLPMIKSMLNQEAYEYFIEEKTQKEIASTHNVSQASVSRKIKRNIKQIQFEFGGREL